MWLDFSILKKCFEEKTIEFKLVKGKRISVEHIKYYFSGNNILQGYLYFVPEYVMAELLSPKGTYIISNKHNDFNNIYSKVDNLLVADEESDVIFDFLENIFSSYIKWEKHFVMDVLSNKPLPLLIELCEEILKNPISITDSGFRVLASSDIETEYMDEEWEYIKKNGYHSGKFVERFLKDEKFQRCMQKPSIFPFFIKKNYLRHESVICPIVTDGKLVAFISLIAANNDIDDACIALLIEISKLMSNVFIREESLITPNILENNTVKDFLLKKNDGFSCREIIEKQLCYQERNNLFVAVLQPVEICNSNFMLLSRIVDEFFRKDVFKYCYILKFDGSIAIICNSTRNMNPRKDVFQFKNDFLEYNHIKIAVSLCADSIDMLPYLYEQAANTMTHGCKVDNKQTILYYEKYFPFHIANEIMDIKKIQIMIHPIFGLLKEADKSGELIQTLETYLLNFFDVEKTAEALHLHRNSVYYRLKKMEAIYYVDFTNEVEKLHLLFSVGLWKKI